MSSFSAIRYLITGLLFLAAASPLRAQQAEAPEVGDDQDPLEVTIRPRTKPMTEGYMEDGVLATDGGRYFLYTGWYIDRLGDRLVPGSLADRALRMGLTDTVLEIIRGDAATDLLYMRDLGLIMGRRYQGMSMLNVADLFHLELGPTPFPRGGFYGQKDLDGPYFLADQIIGRVDFSGSAR